MPLESGDPLGSPADGERCARPRGGHRIFQAPGARV